jgi:hypothetical protein
MNVESDLQRKLAQTDRALFEEMGLGLGRGAIVGDPEERGREFFREIEGRVREAVCRSTSVRLLYEQKADTVFVVAAVTDSVASVLLALSVPISPATLAVLVFRAGISELCRAKWATDTRSK